MSVFRLNNKGQSLANSTDWFASVPYTTKLIIGIDDPDGGKGNEPSSIPSPFARLDLVNTAFKYINEQKDKAGFMFRKIVSDTLDVAEIFFCYEQFGQDMELVEWDKNLQITELIDSQNEEHKRLGHTLQMYLSNDAKAFNFGHMQKVYILRYKHRIIGGTSPLTLFFNTANNLSDVKITFANGDIAFDGHLRGLNQRSEEFQEWLYGMREFYSEFRGLFREVSIYMDWNLQDIHMSNPQLHDKLNKITPAIYSVDNYNEIDNGITILNGLPIYCAKPFNGSVSSDFTLASKKFSGKMPLALQPDHRGLSSSGRPMIYYNAPYNSAVVNVPVSDDNLVESRHLPGLSFVKYPYLTTGDFLEPYLMRLVFPVDKQKFFDGNLSNGGTKGYLLPIKKEYFKYFDVDDLRENLSMEVLTGGAVKVVLKVPIANGDSISYSRIYYTSEDGKADLINNKGVIVEHQINSAVYPFIRLNQDSLNRYCVSILDRNISARTKASHFTPAFFKSSSGNRLIPIGTSKRSDKASERGIISTDYYIVNGGFDFIEISNKEQSGLIVPLFKHRDMGIDKFSFAVDFGTTNTHIEYQAENRRVMPLDITPDDSQIATLHDPDYVKNDASLNGSGATALYGIIPFEMMPNTLGNGSEYSFPMRTALSHKPGLNTKQPTFAMADANIAFTYDKSRYGSNKYRTNLKWTDYVTDSDDLKFIELYFENIILIIRNKAILNGGNLDETKLVWFYPSSMLPHRRYALERTWNELYAKYISADKNKSPIGISESIAPFYYFHNREGVMGDVASIDIGGGTSDVVFYKDNTPHTLTSFRFGANSIFGDAFGCSPKVNGFVQKYTPIFKDLLINNSLSELSEVLRHIEEADCSEDIVSFLFSLENNNKVKEKSAPISLSKELTSDPDLKLVFVLHYSAMIYHLAKLLKARGASSPRYIIFSGTGSKIVNIIDQRKQLTELAELTKVIFESVFEKECGKIDLKQDQDVSPKVVTAKGGLMIDTTVDIKIDEIKAVYFGTKHNRVIDADTKLKYSSLDENIVTEVCADYKDFISAFIHLNETFNFSKRFGVDSASLSKISEISDRDIANFIKAGYNAKLKEIGNNLETEIEETLFFYPLIGVMNKLAYLLIQK